jgi:hypothetical protein
MPPAGGSAGGLVRCSKRDAHRWCSPACWRSDGPAEVACKPARWRSSHHWSSRNLLDPIHPAPTRPHLEGTINKWGYLRTWRWRHVWLPLVWSEGRCRLLGIESWRCRIEVNPCRIFLWWKRAEGNCSRNSRDKFESKRWRACRLRPRGVRGGMGSSPERGVERVGGARELAGVGEWSASKEPQSRRNGAITEQ